MKKNMKIKRIGLAMWSRLTPRLGIGLVFAENLQPFAVIAIGQNIENDS